MDYILLGLLQHDLSFLNRPDYKLLMNLKIGKKNKKTKFSTSE